jgi:hypothetical protein
MPNQRKWTEFKSIIKAYGWKIVRKDRHAYSVPNRFLAIKKGKLYEVTYNHWNNGNFVGEIKVLPVAERR